MPVIPLENTTWDDLFTAMTFLWLEPSTTSFHKPALEAAEGKILLALMQRFGTHHFKVDDHAIDLIAKGAEIGDVKHADQQLEAGAFIAADLLLTTLRLSIYAPEKASLENSIKIVSAREKASGRACSRASLLKTWRRFKCVSHLAAAVPLSLPTFRAMQRAVKTIVQIKKISVPQERAKITRQHVRRYAKELDKRLSMAQRTMRRQVPQFFAKAERLRFLGERHRSFSQKEKSLLNQDEMWTVPPGLPLPHVRLNLPRLSLAERSLLGIQAV